MELNFAIAYIPHRMKELGFSHYTMRYRTVRVLKTKTISIDPGNSILLAINPSSLISIKSKAGIFKLDDSVNEQQYEHRGLTKVRNDGSLTAFVVFIQVIPLHKNNRKKSESNGRDSASI